MWRPDDPALAAELVRLTEAARASDAALRARGGFRPGEDGDGLIRAGSEFLALSPDEGELLYLLAVAMQARRVVEFGASFGLSTLYLAAAMRATGGHLVTTEAHPDKCRALRETFARAGLGETVTLLEGDARETLAGVEGPLDLVFLDGWKGMYLTVFGMLEARLRPGALVVADNVDHPAAQSYVEAVGHRLSRREGGLLVTLIA